MQTQPFVHPAILYLVELQSVHEIKELPVLLLVLEFDVVLLETVECQLGLVVHIHLHRLGGRGLHVREGSEGATYKRRGFRAEREGGREEKLEERKREWQAGGRAVMLCISPCSAVRQVRW